MRYIIVSANGRRLNRLIKVRPNRLIYGQDKSRMAVALGGPQSVRATTVFWSFCLYSYGVSVHRKTPCGRSGQSKKQRNCRPLQGAAV